MNDFLTGTTHQIAATQVYSGRVVYPEENGVYGRWYNSVSTKLGPDHPAVLEAAARQRDFSGAVNALRLVLAGAASQLSSVPAAQQAAPGIDLLDWRLAEVVDLVQLVRALNQAEQYRYLTDRAFDAATDALLAATGKPLPAYPQPGYPIDWNTTALDVPANVRAYLDENRGLAKFLDQLSGGIQTATLIAAGVGLVVLVLIFGGRR